MHLDTDLFTTSSTNLGVRAMEATHYMVREEMNTTLTRDFCRQEVEIALNQIAPLKAPSPNDMPLVFYQHYWGQTSDDVNQAVLFCLNTGKILPSNNHTFISLIPQVKSLDKVTKFRPITLCNILYKLISKVLANRLKTLLPEIIVSTCVPS